ncbi:MAG TPA: VanZ family protein [Xanthobacteraceae bacterium]|nr:VanZ family protein [Xanthobacteraceae bacterium]
MTPRHGPLAVPFRWASWIIFAAIVVVTLGPRSVRPVTPFSANFDRFAAYLVLGACFALAYARRPYLSAVAVIAAAGGLEVAQNFVPGRDGRLQDFLFKAAGVVLGLIAARFIQPLLDRHFPPRRR